MQEKPARPQHEHKSVFRECKDDHNCNIQELHPKILSNKLEKRLQKYFFFVGMAQKYQFGTFHK